LLLLLATDNDQQAINDLRKCLNARVLDILRILCELRSRA